MLKSGGRNLRNDHAARGLVAIRMQNTVSGRRQPVVVPQSPAGDGGREALHEPRVAQGQHPFPNVAFIAEWFFRKRRTRLAEMHRRGRRHFEQAENFQVALAEENHMGHAGTATLTFPPHSPKHHESTIEEKEREFARLSPAERPGKEPPAKHRFPKGFHRGQELFGQHAARLREPGYREFIAQHGLVIVEGFNDVIGLDNLGVPALGIMSNRMNGVCGFPKPNCRTCSARLFLAADRHGRRPLGDRPANAANFRPACAGQPPSVFS